ncbi:MAG: hypothetical protein NC200_07590, partial [Candidatus Gastranaerophilales bacterium]|nr:hypothetical protein [Candidatus Gastranaerophilales bacterium]
VSQNSIKNNSILQKTNNKTSSRGAKEHAYNQIADFVVFGNNSEKVLETAQKIIGEDKTLPNVIKMIKEALFANKKVDIVTANPFIKEYAETNAVKLADAVVKENSGKDIIKPEVKKMFNEFGDVKQKTLGNGNSFLVEHWFNS